MHADEVVSVHHSVNASIEDDREVNVTIVQGVDIEPIKEKDRKVMVNVEERELAPFLPKNNKDRVPKVPNLRHVKQPKEVSDRWLLDVVSVAAHAVSITISKECGFNCHICTEEYLRHVVHELDGIRINGRNSTSLHYC